MMMVYIAAEEAKMNEYATKFDTASAQMKEEQRTTFTHRRFNDPMLHILRQRFKNIDERLMRLYKLKLHFFLQAPTIKN